MYRPARGKARHKRRLKVKTSRQRVDVDRFAAKIKTGHFTAFHRARIQFSDVDPARRNDPFFRRTERTEQEPVMFERLYKPASLFLRDHIDGSFGGKAGLTDHGQNKRLRQEPDKSIAEPFIYIYGKVTQNAFIERILVEGGL